MIILKKFYCRNITIEKPFGSFYGWIRAKRGPISITRTDQVDQNLLQLPTIVELFRIPKVANQNILIYENFSVSFFYPDLTKFSKILRKFWTIHGLISFHRRSVTWQLVIWNILNDGLNGSVWKRKRNQNANFWATFGLLQLWKGWQKRSNPSLSSVQ